MVPLDFPAAPAIRAALTAEAERGYYGYFGDPSSANDAVAGWYLRKHFFTESGFLRSLNG